MDFDSQGKPTIRSDPRENYMQTNLGGSLVGQRVCRETWRRCHSERGTCHCKAVRQYQNRVTFVKCVHPGIVKTELQRYTAWSIRTLMVIFDMKSKNVLCTNRVVEQRY